MENEPPTKQPDHSEIERLKSLVIVNTGDGKGKSTSAFGVIFRALGRDWDTAVIQFLKSGKWKTGETAMAKKLGVDWWEIGEGFTWDSDDLDEDQAIALEAWKQACEVIENGRKINSQTLKLPSGKILKGNERKLFEISKIKTEVLKSELIAKKNIN